MKIRKERRDDGEVRLWASVDDLILDPGNAIAHGQKNLDRIKGSLAHYGQQTPVKIDTANVVVKGNGTLRAARELGWKEVWFSRSELTGAARVGYAIADNRSSEDPDWINDVLGRQLEAIAIEGGDDALEATGFTREDLDNLVKQAEQPEDVQDEDVQEKPASKWEVLVTCEDEATQRKLANRLIKEGFQTLMVTK